VKKWLAEAVGTGLISMTVIGTAYMAASISQDQLLQLLTNALATALVLSVTIYLFSPISGAHFNPVVTLVLAAMRRIAGKDLLRYLSAQIAGGILGTALANMMFADNFLKVSSVNRATSQTLLGELIATTILLTIILICILQDRTTAIPYLVAAWIGSAYFSTVSTSFANPAVTIARVFTENSAGISIESMLTFIPVQIAGGFLALGLVKVLQRG
jgi:glycerol uptake facilitator-like aquaporin